MKKALFFVLSFLILLVALWIGMTWWAGMAAERYYYNALEHVSRTPYAKFSSKAYNRGLFCSSSVTVLEFSGESGSEDEPLRLSFLNDIRHGPFPFARVSEGKWIMGPVMAVIFTSASQGNMALENTKGRPEKLRDSGQEMPYTLLNLDGSGRSSLSVPSSLGIKLYKHAYLSGEDLKSLISFSSGFNTVRGSVSLRKLEFRNAEECYGMEGIETEFDLHEGKGGVYLGSSLVRLSRLLVSFREHGKFLEFDAQDVEAKEISSAEGDIVNAAVGIRVQRGRVGNNVKGAGELEIEFRDMDARSLGKLQRFLREKMTGSGEKQGRKVGILAFAEYAKMIDGFLDKSPEIELTKLSINTDKGDIEGNARIDVNGSVASSIINPLAFMSAINAEAEFSAADDLVEEFTAYLIKKRMLKSKEARGIKRPGKNEVDGISKKKARESLNVLESRKIIVKRGKKYSIALKYGRGKLTLNGAPFSLSR